MVALAPHKQAFLAASLVLLALAHKPLNYKG